MPDLLLLNANVITLDPAVPSATTILVRDGRIAAVGDTLPDQIDPTIPRLDLSGRTVVPGFIDSHVHLTWTGVRPYAVDCSTAQTAQDTLDLVAARVATVAPGNLVLAQGLGPQAVVTGADLDRVAPRHPVLLQGYTGHSAIANGLMLRQLDLHPGDDGLDEHGVLRGAANTRAAWRVPAQFAAQVGWHNVFGSACEMALEAGITTIHALEGEDRADDPAVLALLRMQDKLPVRTVIYYQTRDVAAVQRLGLPRIGGCIWIDGDFEPHTAALQAPYADQPNTCGCLYFSDDVVHSFVDEAHRAGLQIALHCVGDAAVSQVLGAYHRTLAAHPRPDHRHRIEHFEVYDQSLLERTVRDQIHVAIQPPFDGYFGGIAENARFLGAERAQRADAVRTFIDHGIPVGGGSDCPVTPLDALYGIHCAVNHSNPAERIDVERALRLFTIDNARLAFEEDRKGTITPGKFADFAVLDDDPRHVDPQTIKDISVLMTIVGGVVEWTSIPMEDLLMTGAVRWSATNTEEPL
jgi:predicted amidohydrolase YtcJ